MKTIEIKISEWHLAMLESMEKTITYTREIVLEDEIV
jgi:hypothetical protein